MIENSDIAWIGIDYRTTGLLILVDPAWGELPDAPPGQLYADMRKWSEGKLEHPTLDRLYELMFWRDDRSIAGRWQFDRYFALMSTAPHATLTKRLRRLKPRAVLLVTEPRQDHAIVRVLLDAGVPLGLSCSPAQVDVAWVQAFDLIDQQTRRYRLARETCRTRRCNDAQRP